MLAAILQVTDTAGSSSQVVKQENDRSSILKGSLCNRDIGLGLLHDGRNNKKWEDDLRMWFEQAPNEWGREEYEDGKSKMENLRDEGASGGW